MRYLHLPHNVLVLMSAYMTPLTELYYIVRTTFRSTKGQTYDWHGEIACKATALARCLIDLSENSS